MNVLLTSVGRRAYMVKYFQKALNGNGEVHVCNSDKSVAFQYADKSFIAPLIYDKEYIPFLLNYCKENDIDILISLFDIDLLILSKNKKKFEEIGTKVIVSDEPIIQVCNDKWKTYLYLKQNNFNVPKTYLSLDKVKNALKMGEVSFPLIIKPRFGCGSLSLEKVYNEEELEFFSKKASREIANSYLKFESNSFEEKVIFQEILKGQEYGGDIINDLSGVFQNAIIRKKISMHGGETDIAEIVEMPVIYKELKRLGESTGHIANMDCDIFLLGDTPYILEMNARFGGGYPFSHMAGCNLPKAIVEWLNGRKDVEQFLTATTGMVGYKELVITRG